MTSIEWTDSTWNPTVGCSRVSEGCRHCYAEVMAARIANAAQAALRDGRALTARQGAYRLVVRWKDGGTDPAGMHDVAQPRWNGRVVLDEEALSLPLRWRKPRRIFVNSMSDLFHEALSDTDIARVFGAMRCTPHTFQILTKRPKRMREWFANVGTWEGFVTHNGSPPKGYWRGPQDGPEPGVIVDAGDGDATWPLPNVWLGVSVEDQVRAGERIPLLLETPAAVRFLSCEPMLGPVDLTPWLTTPAEFNRAVTEAIVGCGLTCSEASAGVAKFLRDRRTSADARIDWCITGGESGPGARPCDVAWVRSVVDQCKATGVPAFVKQLGAFPVFVVEMCADGVPLHARAPLRDRKGGAIDEWPADIRVREFPCHVGAPCG